MILTPGQLYFINEQDIKTGECSNYYKIGIVRESDERGKTIANNMDLLDVWKTHICPEAKHLFLMIPRIRVTGNQQEQKIFQSVEKRTGTFFNEQAHDIDVESVHLFGY